MHHSSQLEMAGLLQGALTRTVALEHECVCLVYVRTTASQETVCCHLCGRKEREEPRAQHRAPLRSGAGCCTAIVRYCFQLFLTLWN